MVNLIRYRFHHYNKLLEIRKSNSVSKKILNIPICIKRYIVSQLLYKWCSCETFRSYLKKSTNTTETVLN
jgi:hypothetical protein